jgi:ABC-type Fe3+ transport system permease subunit
VSIAAACVWSLARSVCIATVGALLALRICRVLRSGETRGGRVLWALILLPVFTPGLLVGYGYRNFSLSLVHQPLWNEAVYTGLTLLLTVPIGALILLASPPAPISPSGLHVALLLRKQGSPPLRMPRRVFVGLQLRARLYALLPAWAAMFLLSFQETENATLMQAAGWPEWTFTRLATGMELADTAWSLLLPVAIQLAVIGAALGVIGRGSVPATVGGPLPNVSTPQRAITWGYGAVAILLLFGVPGSYVLRGAWEGVSVLAAHPRLMQQIGIGLLFGTTAGLLAWLASGAIVERLRQGTRLLLFLPLLLPGLLGAWLLGLGLAVLFQQPPLRGLYDTPVPMILGEVLFQLPRALLVRLLLGRWRDSSAAHAARLMEAAADAPRRRRAAALLWRLDGRARLTGALVICYWAYMELSIPSPALLGPPGMTSAPVLLYNQMHYGQIPGLSALVLATLAVPVVCLCVLSFCARSVAIWRHS